MNPLRQAAAEALLDLAAHDVSTEARDHAGRWTDTASLHELLKPSGDNYSTHEDPDVQVTAKWLAAKNTKFPGEPSYAEVAEAYEWGDRDRVGSDGKNVDGILQQGLAQIHAKAWDADTNGKSPKDRQYADSIWEAYQNPDLYSNINKMLRTGEKDPDSALDVPEVRRLVGVMFDEAGFTTTKPMKVYRALKSKRASTFEPGDDTPTVDWAEKLKPGTVFEEDGIVSTTAHNRLSQGWLAINPTSSIAGDQREVQPNDVMMEIHLPKGTRIVGGNPEFIETMLKPGTRFKVKSSERRKAEHPEMPLGGDASLPAFYYTHVIAEVQP